MKRPRKHHFIPQFYLKGFTVSGTEDGQLFVLDQSRLKQWESSPEKSANEQDMYDVAPGTDADLSAFERAFANLEGQFGQVVKNTIGNKRLPEGDDLNVLLNFVMMMAVRVPAIRDTMEEINDVLHKKMIREQIATTEGWESFKQACREQGREIDAGDEHELRASINSDDYTIGQGQNWYLKMMTEVTRDLHPLLTSRKWVLWIAPDDAPDFVCSDFPVAVSWLKGALLPFPPAHGLRKTLVTFPLNRRMAMGGTFEGVLQADGVNEKIIAGINAMTSKQAKQVYSAAAEYVCSAKQGIVRASEILETLRAQRSTRNQTEGNE